MAAISNSERARLKYYAGFAASEVDAVHHPPHYAAHPSGVECIEIAEHFGFRLGSAIKYIWRADLKGKPVEDLKKARWMLDREIAWREGRAESEELGGESLEEDVEKKRARRPRSL